MPDGFLSNIRGMFPFLGGGKSKTPKQTFTWEYAEMHPDDPAVNDWLRMMIEHGTLGDKIRAKRCVAMQAGRLSPPTARERGFLSK